MFSFGGDAEEDAEDYSCAGLSYYQRLSMFVILGAIACVFLFLASLAIFMPRKFIKLYTLGVLFTISAFSFLIGPKKLATSLFDSSRIVASSLYIGSIILTLVSAVKINSYFLSLASIIVQFGCMAWLAASYIPFAQTVLRRASSMILPI